MSTPRYKPLANHEIERLSDRRLLEYMRAARAAGDAGRARYARAVLAFGYEAAVHKRIKLKAPAEAVPDIAQEVFRSVLTSAFDGNSIGEFRSWLHTIVDRRIADHHRSARPPDLPLFDERADDGAPPGHAAVGESENGAAEARIVLDGILARHPRSRRMAIRLHAIDGVPARETAEQVTRECQAELARPMTETNVQKIAQRFRAELRMALSAGPEGSAP